MAVVVGWQCVGVPSAAAAASTLDLVTFTAPAGWTVEDKGGGIGKHVVLTRVSNTSYCRIAIYSSTPASVNLNASFDAEWTSVALQTIDRVPTPTPTMRTVGNTRAAVGGATSRVQGQPVLGMLIVLDAGTSVVSMVVITPTVAAFDAYSADIQAMLSTLVVRRVGASSEAPATNSETKLVVPAPSRRMVVADLVGEWGRNDGINTRLVDRGTGVYAGTDSLHFTDTWVITAGGRISRDFFGLDNGKKIADTSTGVVSFSATGLSDHQIHGRAMVCPARLAGRPRHDRDEAQRSLAGCEHSGQHPQQSRAGMESRPDLGSSGQGEVTTRTSSGR